MYINKYYKCKSMPYAEALSLWNNRYQMPISKNKQITYSFGIFYMYFLYIEIMIEVIFMHLFIIIINC